MPRIRTTKILAQRIDLSYFRRPHPFRTLRTVLIALMCLAPLVWWGAAAAMGHRMIYNPGPIAAVHAMWASNCAVCHDAGGTGGFSKSVSDEACLRCHDGAIHHSNQLTLVALDVSGHPLHSAGCAACHIEHRGRAALMASDDATCIQCHRDLASHSRSHPVVQNDVSRFDADGGHPHFGRSLTPAGKSIERENWTDPTVLFFNHKVHMEKVAPRKGQSDNCTKCHIPSRASMASVPDTAPGSGRYMQPVNYLADCSTSDCHPIQTKTLSGDFKPTLADNLLLPHANLGEVRSAVERYLSPALAAQKFEGPGKAPAAPRIGGIRRPAASTPVVNTISRDEWLRQNARFMLDNIHKANYSGTPPDSTLIADSTAISDAYFVDLYTAFIALNQCTKCHNVQGDFPSLTASSGPAAKPLQTVPTGITAAPRRWFVNSTFDHRSHQNLRCIACHGSAPTSTLTSDVLSPDIRWTDSNKQNVSCADCHHLSTSSQAGASSNCVTCHIFHDRSRERLPDGPMDIKQAVEGQLLSTKSPTSRPAAGQS